MRCSLNFIAMALLAGSAIVAGAHAEVPVVTDSRIKTFVYNENEVFTITTHYGYQSNIEFGEKETIDTVSVGDRVAWQIIPAGRRLFIRAQEENAHTNMTIVTNLRAYQFDLRSSSADAVFGSEELTYVVRFFYPGESTGAMPVVYAPPPAPVMQPQAPISLVPPTAQPTATPVAYSTPAPARSYVQPAAPTAPANNSSYNYRYTFSGPNTIAPVKIYDDGRATFFKFKDGKAPQFAVITARGEEMNIPARRVDSQTYAVDMVAPRFSLRNSGAQVIVYNESGGA